MATDDPEYVPHPRYGAGPRYTGLDVDPADPAVKLHWRATPIDAAHLAAWERMGLPTWKIPAPSIIPGTAVVADPGRHTGGSYLPITHYYDEGRACRRCRRPFLFFAAEQQHWYEELGFNLSADCVECHPCRHARQRLDRLKRRHDELLARPERTATEGVELADCCLRLIEAGAFTPRRAERVRFLLNRLPADWADRVEVIDLRARLGALPVDPPAG